MTLKNSSAETKRRTPPRGGPVPKLCGADVEVGNVVRGMDGPRNTARMASRLLLREIPGIPHSRWFNGAGSSGRFDYSYSYTTSGEWSSPGVKAGPCPQSKSSDCESQDWGRRFLASNGGCAYIDLNHLELCIPEVLSAADFVAAWHAMLLVAHGDGARQRGSPPGPDSSAGQQ